MFEKYFKPGVKLELHSVNRTFAKEENVATKIYLSKINQLLTDNKIEIMMPMAQAKYALLPKDTIYEMVIFTEHGLYECNVKMDDRYKNGNIYLQVVEVVGEMKRHQRREFYRYECSLPIYCRHATEQEHITMIWDRDITGIECTTLDISGGGVRFLADGIFDKDLPVICAIELMLEGSIKEVQAMGKILNISPLENDMNKREVRVVFEKISNATREDIIHYIFEDERKRRSKNNGF